MVINSTGEVFVGWKETSGPETAGIRTGYSHSSDGGWSWAANILMPQKHPDQGCHNSDPWMALAPDNKLHYAYLEYDCGVSGLDVVNTTNGKDWGTVHEVLGRGGLVDKDSITFAPNGRLYATWDEGNVLAITWSDDGGTTWATPKDPSNGTGGLIGALVKTSPAGSNVYLAWWDFGTNNIMFSWSGDAGQTWHTAIRVNDQPGSASQYGAWGYPLPAMFVDPSSGTLYAAWMDQRNGIGNPDIYMASSSNGGQSWSTNHKINDDTGTAAQFMPDITVDSGGKVHAAWEDDRGGNHDIYYSNSTNGGLTWSTNVRVTTASTPVSYRRPGDYFSIRAGPKDYIYIVWTDGRGSDFDIYFARNPGFDVATVTVATDPAALKVTVDGQSLTAPSQQYWLVGSSHVVGTTSPQVAGRTRYLWQQWSDGGGITHIIKVTSDTTLTARFKTQYQATLGTDPAGLIFRADNVSYNQSASLWWDKGSSHWLDAPSPQPSGAGVRYVWAKWSDGGSQAHAVQATAPMDATATFQQQQSLLVSTNPANLTFYLDGFSYSNTTTFWLPLATYHQVELDSPQAGTPGVRYTFVNWSDGKAANHTFLFSGTMSLTAQFHTDYFLTVASPVAGASGSGWYASGSTAYATAPASGNESSGQRLAFQGWGGDASGTGTTSNPITMSGPKTAIANYGKQYYLDVRSDFGTTSGSGWYDPGTVAQAGVGSATVPSGPGAQHVFTGWSGDASGSGTTSSITMNGPKVAVALWKAQYYLTIQSQYGKPVGQGWYDAGQTVKAALDVSHVQLGSGTRATFVGWSGDATGTDASGSSSITMDRPRTVVATWHTEYELKVETAYGTGSGAGWYAAGSTAFASVSPDAISTGEGSRVAFVGWTADGNASGSDPSRSNPITMDRPRTTKAQWQNQFLVTVASDVGTVPGSGWYEAGSSVTLQAPQQISSAGHTYSFAGWKGDLTSLAATFTFTVDRPLTIKATWTSAEPTSPLGTLSSPPALAVLVVIVAVVVGVVALLRRRRHRT